MTRVERFTFMCNREEKHLIAVLADLLKRTQSDAVRFVVVSAARELLGQDGLVNPSSSTALSEEKTLDE